MYNYNGEDMKQNASIVKAVYKFACEAVYDLNTTYAQSVTAMADILMLVCEREKDAHDNYLPLNKFFIEGAGAFEFIEISFIKDCSSLPSLGLVTCRFGVGGMIYYAPVEEIISNLPEIGEGENGKWRASVIAEQMVNEPLMVPFFVVSYHQVKNMTPKIWFRDWWMPERIRALRDLIG